MVHPHYSAYQKCATEVIPLFFWLVWELLPLWRGLGLGLSRRCTDVCKTNEREDLEDHNIPLPLLGARGAQRARKEVRIIMQSRVHTPEVCGKVVHCKRVAKAEAPSC